VVKAERAVGFMGRDIVDADCEGPGPLQKPRRDLNVLICDWRQDRGRHLERWIATLGAAVHVVVGRLDGLENVEAFGLALVAVDADPPLSSEVAIETHLAAIEQLRHRSIPAICYGHGSQRWPLWIRCRILLAGALTLLDSCGAEFERELGREVQARVETALSEGALDGRLAAALAELGIVGSSSALHRVLRAIDRSARLSDMPVLLLGESGTGKELLARAVHRLDPGRCKGPFVAINCAALTKTLAEADLFGHRKGVFSGADRERAGFVRGASGGVLFLDEVAELDLELQAKLLRVIQERRVLTLGDVHETAVDVRMVAATHRDLKTMVRQGHFRADLLNRLWVYPVEVPPLRERRDDIPALLRFFLLKHAGPTRSVQSDFLEALQLIEFEGNVRQLENVVQRAIAVADIHRPLGLVDLPSELWLELSERRQSTRRETALQERNPAGPCGDDLNLLRNWVLHERQLVEAALRAAGGNQTRAASLMGISTRSLYNKLRKHRLTRRDCGPR
jgi:transcriptional regulator with GAF, ATPase, and Fis domain